MSDNQNKNNSRRLKIVLSGFPAVFCSIFIPYKKGRIIFNSQFNMCFGFNSKYLFLYMLKKNYDVYFVINDPVYRKQLTELYGPHFIETKSFKGKIFALRAKLWFVSAFEMPVGGIGLKLKHTVIHLTHGSLVKNVGMLEKDCSFIKKIYYTFCIRTNLSYSVATSHFFIPSTAAYTGLPEKKILVTGFPRNDALYSTQFIKNGSKPESLTGCGFSVLYAPTWRKHQKIKLFPFSDVDYSLLNDFLEKNDITIFIRLHPNDEKEVPQGILQSRIKIFSSTEYDEIMDYLNYFDSLITDYSSILYDFLLLDRPLLFLPYDYEEYDKKVGFAVDYNMITPGAKPKSFYDFKEALLDMKTKDSFKTKRHEICDLCNELKSNNCKRLEEVLIDKGILVPVQSL